MKTPKINYNNLKRYCKERKIPVPPIELVEECKYPDDDGLITIVFNRPNAKIIKKNIQIKIKPSKFNKNIEINLLHELRHWWQAYNYPKWYLNESLKIKWGTHPDDYWYNVLEIDARAFARLEAKRKLGLIYYE